MADSYLGSEPLPGTLRELTPDAVLALAAVLLVAVAVLKELQSRSGDLARTYASETMALAFRARILRHAQRLSVIYHDAAGTADSTYRIMWDANAISSIAIDGLIPIVVASITAVSMLVIIVALDAQLSVVALVITPALFLSSRRYRRLIRPRYRHVKQVESSALAVVQEVLTSLRVVKAFGQEDREHARFMVRASEGVRARVRIAVSEGIYGVLNKGIVAVGSAGVLYLGALHVQSGTLTLGGLLLILGYVAMLYDPISTIASRTGHAVGADGRGTGLRTARRGTGCRRVAAPDPRHAGRGPDRVRDVTFRYREGPLALDDLSFEVPAGSRVGILGATGAGKTTLVSLLTRSADPISGRVLLDGVDLRDYRLADLRDQFAIVLQEPVLFSTTIAENIAYAREGATFEQIVAAARIGERPRLHHGAPERATTPPSENGA